jgi:hypothetical protein
MVLCAKVISMCVHKGAAVKLKTERAFITSALQLANSYGLGSRNVKAEIHDAAAAHALMQAIQGMGNHCILEDIKANAGKLMREWGFEE